MSCSIGNDGLYMFSPASIPQAIDGIPNLFSHVSRINRISHVNSQILVDFLETPF